MIRKVVFPVAGLGTRLLPATKEIPKEILPVIDKPLIHYAVEEALASGCEEFILVTARGKEALENYLRPTRNSSGYWPSRARAGCSRGWKNFTPNVSFFCASPGRWVLATPWPWPELAVGDEPFAMSLPDDLIISRRPVLAQMAKVFQTYRVADYRLDARAGAGGAPRYGIVAGDAIWRKALSRSRP